jgi:hypothetical protein
LQYVVRGARKGGRCVGEVSTRLGVAGLRRREERAALVKVVLQFQTFACNVVCVVVVGADRKVNHGLHVSYEKRIELDRWYIKVK